MGDPHDPCVKLVLDAMHDAINSRHWAADKLSRVAEFGQAGCWPNGVTCEEVGMALYRIAMNAPDEDPLMAILKGWRYAARKKHTDCFGPL